jgi:hypothetical protein
VRVPSISKTQDELTADYVAYWSTHSAPSSPRLDPSTEQLKRIADGIESASQQQAQDNLRALIWEHAQQER